MISILYNFLIYLIIFLLSLPFFEIVLEKFNPEQLMVHVEDPSIVYQFYPNREGVAFTPEYKVNVRTNLVHMRDCDNLNHSPKSSKILILGDSFSEGWGVECNETYHYPLNDDYEVFNGGIHGGSLPYYVVKNRKLLPLLKPNIILIQIFDNDLDDSDKIESFFSWNNGEITSAKPRGILGFSAGKISTFLRELTLTRLIKRISAGLVGRKEPIKYYKLKYVPNEKVLTHEESIKAFGKLRNIIDYEKEYNGQFEFYKFKTIENIANSSLWKRRFESFETVANQLIRESKKESPSTEVIFVYIPAKESLFGYKNAIEYRSTNPFLQLLEKISIKNRIRLMDASHALSTDPELYYFPGDAHLNVTGHKVLSEFLIKSLK